MIPGLFVANQAAPSGRLFFVMVRPCGVRDVIGTATSRDERPRIAMRIGETHAGKNDRVN